ncbi:MAG TPA: non-homologous end-joining DNA ligase [Polyangiaceae bacterium]|nr:non-homologous end-joining DNA ligase [Polyangiaceae bacterium]
MISEPGYPLTHPEKLLFPGDGITKADVASYYSSVAPLMLPHLDGRPVTMERYPAGIDRPGFIQKNVAKGFPEWLERAETPKKDGMVFYPVVRDVRSLLWLANQNCITPHVWPSRLPELDRPDLCVVDLDPPGDDAEGVHAAALAVRELLAELGLVSFVKTSGSKGFHIVVPLEPSDGFESVWRFAHGFGAVLVKRHPDALTQEFIKADRAGRILIDTGRNGYGATFAAAYAIRPKPGAPVSAPCTWDEIERRSVSPRSFTLRTMTTRMDAAGDPWADVAHHRQSLGSAMERLSALLTEDDWKETLAARTRRPGPRKGASRTRR